jgi:hypothetical protein
MKLEEQRAREHLLEEQRARERLLEEKIRVESERLEQEKRRLEEKRRLLLLEKLRKEEEEQEEERLIEERRILEVKRVLEENRLLEEKRLLEQKRKDNQLENHEKQKADQAVEEKRLKEEKRLMDERRLLEEKRQEVQQEKQRQEAAEAERRHKELEEQLRRTGQDDRRRAEEELRAQQREKLKIFQLEKLFEEQKELHVQQKEKHQAVEEKEYQASPSAAATTTTARTSTTTWRTVFGNADKEEKPQTWDTKSGGSNSNSASSSSSNGDTRGPAGVAFASITIEDVGQKDDFETMQGGIVRKKPGISSSSQASLSKPSHMSSSFLSPSSAWASSTSRPEEKPEYEYEYYEADADEIRFPVPREKLATNTIEQASQAQGLEEASLNKLSNKELLLRLLKESNNFQNQDFLSRLKSIVLSKGDELEQQAAAGGDSSANKPVRLGVQTPAEGGGWAPSASPVGGSVPNSVVFSGTGGGGATIAGNGRPIWPSRNSLLPPTDQPQVISNNGFEPSRPLRFPVNRRTDDDDDDEGGGGGGVGEVSLVTGPELARTTALGGFGTAAVAGLGGLSPQSEIAHRVDVSSGEEFVVGTSLAMGGGRPGRLENSLAGIGGQQGKLTMNVVLFSFIQ